MLVYHILCRVIIIHHKRHDSITRTTVNDINMKWFEAGTKKMSGPSFGIFIKSIA